MITKKKIVWLVFDLGLIGWGSVYLYRSLSNDPLADENSFWIGMYAIVGGIFFIIETLRPSVFKKLKNIYTKNKIS